MIINNNIESARFTKIRFEKCKWPGFVCSFIIIIIVQIVSCVFIFICCLCVCASFFVFFLLSISFLIHYTHKWILWNHSIAIYGHIKRSKNNNKQSNQLIALVWKWASGREREREIYENWRMDVWRYARSARNCGEVKNSNKYHELILSTMLKRKKCVKWNEMKWLWTEKIPNRGALTHQQQQ